MATEIDLNLLDDIGGTERSAGDGSGEKIYNFGFVPHEERSAEAQEYVAKLEQILVATALPDRRGQIAAAPLPNSNGILISDDSRTFLWDYVRPWNPALTFVRQCTGSCVGAGGGSMLLTRSSVDVYALGQAEKPVFPFWLLAYGKSRQYLGLNNHGDGSSGTTWAKAIGVDGFLDAQTMAAKVPFTLADNFAYNKKIEGEWAYGKGLPADIAAQAKPYVAKLVKQVTSVDELIEHVHVHKRPFTLASDWGGYAPGTDVPVAGSRFPVRLNQRKSTWQHQLSGQGYWRHPELNDDLFYILNQWGRGVHGKPLHGEIPGGFFIGRKDMAYIIKQKEVFVYDSLAGIEGQPDLSTV